MSEPAGCTTSGSNQRLESGRGVTLAPNVRGVAYSHGVSPRTPPKDRRPTQRRAVRTPPHPPTRGRANEPDLIQEIRRALESDQSIELLALVSTLLVVFDPDETPDPSSVDLFDDFLESLMAVDTRETTAALHVLAALLDDDMRARRIRRRLSARRQPMPRWISSLAKVRIRQTSMITDPFGDVEQLWAEVAWPSGETLSAAAMISRTEGGRLMDGLVFPATLAEVVEQMRAVPEVEGLTVQHTDPADVRAKIEAAIADAGHVWPRVETDTWPAAKALLQWVLRFLPEGGSDYRTTEWNERRTRELVRRYRGSAEASHSLDEDDIVETLIHFAGYTDGDPLRWSPAKVEILLTSWVPRKLLADRHYLAQIPTVLRGYVRYCGRVTGQSGALVSEILAAVDALEPEYLGNLPGSERRAGGRRASNGRLGDQDDEILDDETLPQFALRLLTRAVGGDEALRTLDTRPLPDEPFSWDAVPDDVATPVAEVLDLLDRFADERAGVEYRTGLRRYLALVAASDPRIFRRKASPVTAAAAVVMAVVHANARAGERRWISDVDIARHFGLSAAPTSRESTMVKALQADQVVPRWLQPETSVLASVARQGAIERRDHYRRDVAEGRDWLPPAGA